MKQLNSELLSIEDIFQLDSLLQKSMKMQNEVAEVIEKEKYSKAADHIFDSLQEPIKSDERVQ